MLKQTEKIAQKKIKEIKQVELMTETEKSEIEGIREATRK